MEVSTMQIAAMIGKSERQVQRLIKSGKLSAHHIKLNVYSVDRSDIEALTPGQVQSIDAERIEALEARIEALERYIKALDSKAPGHRRPPRSVQATTYDDIADGAVLMHVFAKAHGMSVETVRSQIKTDIIKALDIDSSSRPGTKERYFTPEQQRQSVQVWKSNPRYHDCELCPHN